MKSSIFIKHFIKDEEPEDILDASYIIASKKIFINDERSYPAIHLLYPPSNVIIQLNPLDKHKKPKWKNNSDYLTSYYGYLLDNISSISEIIKDSIINNNLTVILTTDKEEDSLGILYMIRKYVKRNFQYDIQEYESDSKLSEMMSFEDKEILDICEQYIKTAKKDKKRKLLSGSSNDRREYFKSLGIKKIKKKLKKDYGFDLSDYSDAEIIDYALTYL